MSKNPNTEKSRSLFDHINQIRWEKNPAYFGELSEKERKSFNQYIVLLGLSMDSDCIDEVSYLSKYMELIPDAQFYKVCCDIIPKSRKYCKWIKSLKYDRNPEITKKISQYYKVGLDIARQYYDVMIESSGNVEIAKILSKYGLSEKEIDKLLK